MTVFAAVSLTFVMLALAATPSASVALVVTRSATLGFANGAAVTLGIVLGDLVFVALSILGMSFLAETMGGFFAVLKYLGGAYLIWMGINLMRSHSRENVILNNHPGSLLASLTSGFLLTLGDLKAILFYASLLPSVVDMSQLSAQKISMIALITIITVGGTKLLYALAARHITIHLKNAKHRKFAQSASGCLVIGAGSYLIVKS